MSKKKPMPEPIKADINVELSTFIRGANYCIMDQIVFSETIMCSPSAKELNVCNPESTEKRKARRARKLLRRQQRAQNS